MSSSDSQPARVTVIGRSQRVGSGADRQRVVDPEHHCNYSQVPHLLLEDSAAGKLHPAAVVLYLHYKRLAFEQHGHPIDETLRETKDRTGLSNGTILAARGELERTGWLQVEKAGQRAGQQVTITLSERWADNCEQHEHLGQKLTKAEELGQKPAKLGQKPAKFGRNLTKAHLKIGSFKTVEDYEDPLSGAGNLDRETTDTRGTGHEPQLPGMLTEVPRACAGLSLPDDSAAAEELLESFYRDGLGGDPGRDLASRQRQRELESARSLVESGATPVQVATWAREKIAEGRITFVTLATLVQAWPAWRAARRTVEAGAARRTMAYVHEPWGEDRPPPIAASDLARGAAL